MFPTSLLSLGMSAMPMGESQIAYAHNKWMIKEFCSRDERLKFLPFLPFQDPDMCVRMIREFGANPSVCGFLVTSVRYDPVHDNSTCACTRRSRRRDCRWPPRRPTWEDEWMKTMNRFSSMHAISFVHCNIVHMTTG